MLEPQFTVVEPGLLEISGATPESVGEEPSLAELARVIKAGARIEASFKRGKGEVGMDEYQVRTWPGWHHHMALSLLAVWFLIVRQVALKRK